MVAVQIQALGPEALEEQVAVALVLRQEVQLLVLPIQVAVAVVLNPHPLTGVMVDQVVDPMGIILEPLVRERVGKALTVAVAKAQKPAAATPVWPTRSLPAPCATAARPR